MACATFAHNLKLINYAQQWGSEKERQRQRESALSRLMYYAVRHLHFARWLRVISQSSVNI